MSQVPCVTFLLTDEIIFSVGTLIFCFFLRKMPANCCLGFSFLYHFECFPLCHFERKREISLLSCGVALKRILTSLCSV
ncbi:MAG: hypothetical protein KatS3mg033_0885 [Thermonema sp.]|nr:MAG: hypothetical protein KatS3mg033_0885 [Thermonema sp.]